MSSLDYHNHTIADVECQNVGVGSAVGRYQLLFELSFDLKNWEGSRLLRGYVPSLTSLRVVVKLNGAVLGTAFPEEEDFLPPVYPRTPNTVAVRRSFALDIDPRTLDRIEQEREGQDIAFELEVLGTGTVFALRDANSQHASSLPKPLGIEPLLFEPRPAKAAVYHRVSQSDWVRLLDRMGYARILLYEIPMPKGEDGGLKEAIAHFESARRSFLSGYYKEAVARLRESLESAQETIGVGGPRPIWTKAAEDKTRKAMQLQERFLLVWHDTRHLTQLAHHGGDYTREEAHYILGMGALALSLAANAPGVLSKT